MQMIESGGALREHFGDHSANERTLLAWIRTGIAIMAFGFLVEKFTLFLNYLRIALHQRQAIAGGGGAQVIGLVLIAVGIVTIVSATIRFRQIEVQIDAPEVVSQRRSTSTIALGMLIAVAGALLLVYLLFQLGG